MDDEKLNNPRARAPFKVILEDSESEDDTYSLPSSNDRPEPHPKDKNDVRETDMIKPEVTRHEPCSLCQTETMKEPRATSCQHIFCQICIKDHYKKDRTCPICRFPFGQRLCLTSEKGVEDAFRSIHQLALPRRIFAGAGQLVM
jgi:zinc-RING finger domain